MLRYAIFDLDGTLLNTALDLADCVNAAMRRYGFREYTEDDVRLMVGNGSRNLMIRCTGLQDDKKIDEICSWYNGLYAKNYHNRTCAYDGIAENLAKLQAAGIGMAVLSNKPQLMTANLIAECLPEIRFLSVLGQREGVALKPDPAAVREILELMGASPEETAYFGDSEVDVKTAKNAGLPLYTVTWGFRSEETLRGAGAEVFLRAPDEIPGVFGL